MAKSSALFKVFGFGSLLLMCAASGALAQDSERKGTEGMPEECATFVKGCAKGEPIDQLSTFSDKIDNFFARFKSDKPSDDQRVVDPPAKSRYYTEAEAVSHTTPEMNAGGGGRIEPIRIDPKLGTVLKPWEMTLDEKEFDHQLLEFEVADRVILHFLSAPPGCSAEQLPSICNTYIDKARELAPKLQDAFHRKEMKHITNARFRVYQYPGLTMAIALAKKSASPTPSASQPVAILKRTGVGVDVVQAGLAEQAQWDASRPAREAAARAAAAAQRAADVARAEQNRRETAARSTQSSGSSVDWGRMIGAFGALIGGSSGNADSSASSQQPVRRLKKCTPGYDHVGQKITCPPE